MAPGRTPREAEEVVGQIARHSPDVIWMFSPDWSELKFVSDAYEDIWGRSIGALERDPSDFLEGIHPHDRDLVERRMAQLSREESVEVEYRVNEAEGYRRHVWVEGEPVYGADGEFVGVAGFARDITERKRDREKLKRQAERFAEFASVVSHDLKNPLTVAQGHLELAREVYDDDHLVTVAQMLDRMESIITDTMALARHGKTVIETEDIDVEDFIGTCLETIDAEALSVDVVDPFRFRGNPNRLRNLFENLLQNAVDHGGEGVTVRVGRLETAGFYVEDTGPGIPASDRDRVLEPGFTTTDSGTGFGLAIVSRIAEAHGWDLGVSESMDGGARFEFRDVDIVKDG